MPAHAYLVNVGRGTVIDEAALAEALRAGQIAGAGLDVFEAEPLDCGSPLWEMPNVVLTPHIGSWTRDQSVLAAEVLIENLSRELDGRPLINLIDRTIWGISARPVEDLMMSVLDRLATSLGRRGDEANQELAAELAQSGDAEDIAELVDNLSHKNRRIASDCVKTLYELGYLAPEWIAPHVDAFLALLDSKNNRLVWGGMTALSTYRPAAAPMPFYRQLDRVTQAMEQWVCHHSRRRHLGSGASGRCKRCLWADN